MRTTKNPKLALERLVEHLDGRLEKASMRTYRVTVPRLENGGSATVTGTAKKCLATLIRWCQYPADKGGFGMEPDEVREAILLRHINSTGLHGSELDRIREVLV